MKLIPALPPLPSKPLAQLRSVSSYRILERTVLINFSVFTWILLGGLVQLAISALTPSEYSIVVPTIISCVLVYKLTNALAVHFGLIKNSYLEGALLGAPVSAQIPDTNGDLPDHPAAEQVAVLHLGFKLNSPMGIFSYGAYDISTYFTDMVRDLDANKATNGYLGGSWWTSYNERGATETTFIAYFRTIEAIQEFSSGPIHRACSEWWGKQKRETVQHIGINHEIFLSKPGQWENTYLNCQPTLLGATTVFRKGDEDMGGDLKDSWVNPLVEASKGPLRFSAGRLGRNV